MDYDQIEQDTDYKTLTDQERFEEQVITGQRGYYDKVEKVFIPERVLIFLFEEIKHQADSLSDIRLNTFFDKSRRRLSVNFKQIDSLNRDSYSQIFIAYLSRRFLLQSKNKTEVMAILYIDLVASTALSAIISPEQLSKLVKMFSQETSIMISKHNGYVLKYAGDAVIGYFPKDPNIQNACENAVNCAFNLLRMIDESVNVVLFENRYPKLKIRIAVDAGENQIVVLGSDPDLIGHVISKAAKIMGKAKPNQIVIGDKVFNNVNPNLKKKFQQAESFILHETKESYAIYLSKGNN
jgi:class 3 adenylate cyclase